MFRFDRCFVITAAALTPAAAHSAQVSCVETLICSATQPLDEYGNQVSLHAGRAIVGGSQAGLDGAACIFEESLGAWTEAAHLTSPSPSGFEDAFGWDVAIHGDHAVVGAPFEGAPGDQAPGAAYAYRRDAGGAWNFVQRLSASGTTSINDRFGIAVALDGDRLIVGSVGDDTVALDAGAAYLYGWNGAQWVLEDKVLPTAVQPSIRFGLGVDVHGDRAVVGAPFENYLGFGGLGAAYVYDRTPAGAWPFSARIECPDPGERAFFAVGVAVHGARIALGAEGVDNGTGSESGRAYVYALAMLGWTLEDRLDPSHPAQFETFGNQIDIEGNDVLVSARGDGTQGTNAGAGHLFRNHGAGWVHERALLSPNPQPFANFSTSVALGPGVAFLGADGDGLAGINAGAAYLISTGGTDCNGNGLPDDCDLLAGIETDVDQDGIIDVCEELGLRYCSPNVPNSVSATGGRLTVLGTALATATDVELYASRLPMHAFGYFLNSVTEGFAPFPPGSSGILCLGGSVGRFVLQVQNSGAAGQFMIPVDLSMLPSPGGPVTVMSGQTWRFQAWYRDLVTGGVTSNFTDAVAVTFN